MSDPLPDLGSLDLGDGPMLPPANPDQKGRGIMKEPSEYQYQPLNGESSIRLIELAPAHSSTDDLHVRLVERDVWESSNKYEPISYVWGPPVFSESIIINNNYVLMITKSLAEALRHFRLADEPRLVWADAVCINQKDNDEKSKQVSKMDIIYRQGGKTLAWLGHGFQDNHVAFDSLKNVAVRASELSIYAWSISWGSAMSPEEHAIALEIVNSLPIDSLRSFFSHGWFSRMWVVQEVVLSAKLELFCGEESLSLEELVLACAVFRHLMGTVGCGGLAMYEMEPCWYLAQVQSNFQGFLLPFKGSQYHLPFLRTLSKSQLNAFQNNDLTIQLQYMAEKAEDSAPTAILINGQTIPLVPGMSIPMNFVRSVKNLPATHSSYSGSTGIKVPKPDFFLKSRRPTLTIASPMTLLDYITEAVWSGKKCFDQRDLVYAVIGFKYDHDLRVIPDYNKPIIEVYRDLAAEYLKLQYLRVLYFAAQHRDPLGNQHSFPDDPWRLPSWTPDWRIRGRAKGFQGVLDDSFHAATKAIPSIFISDDKLVMKIRGTLISSIQAAIRVIVNDQVTRKMVPEHDYLNCYLEIISMIRHGALKHAQEDGKYPTGEEVLSALARVLTVDYRTLHMYRGKITPHSEKSHGEMWAEFEQRALAPTGDFFIAFQSYRVNPAGNLSPFENANFTELANFIRLVMGHLYKHKFGLLENKYMGLFPADAKEEDLVVVFDGAETPFVVRDVGDEGDYVLIGDCYILGLMEEEVLTEEWEGFRMFFSVR